MGRVIGRGGRVLEELGKEYGCKLQFHRNDENSNKETPLEITSQKGNKDGVEAVKKAVHAIVSNFKTHVTYLEAQPINGVDTCLRDIENEKLMNLNFILPDKREQRRVT